MRQRQPPGKCGDRRGTGRFHPSTDSREKAFFGVDYGGAFRCDPELAAFAFDHLDAAHFRQFVEKCIPLAGGWQHDQCQKRIVKFVGIANDRPRFAESLFNRGWIERADVAGISTECSSHLDRAGPAFLERRVVEVGIRVRVQNFVGQR